MSGKRRKYYGDGRWEPVYPPRPLPPEVEGLDRVPTEKLPPEVTTVFFGGGWYRLYRHRVNEGYVDGHFVYVSPFYISLRPVSIKDWKALMGSYEHPLYKEGDSEDRSAKVTWSDAIQYCIKRSESECLEQCYRETDSGYDCDWNANGYRLPTEAEFNYAAPNFIRRLSARPDSFPEKDEKKTYDYVFENPGSYYLKWAGYMTMFWDFYDRDYFRNSPELDPTGPREGSIHAARIYSDLPFPSNNNHKPWRAPLGDDDRCQFYVARSRIFDYNLHHTNLLNYIPQWDL